MRFEKDLLGKFDAEIRAGRGQYVHQILAKINLATVPREDLLPLANICRRIALYPLGLKLLGPIVYPESKSADPASSREIAEYALLLARSGIHRESQTMLAKVNVDEAPEALLFRAYTHFERWEFEPAVGLLERYLQTPIEAYPRLVGRVNLAYAYVGSGQTEKALATLHENINACVDGNYGVLHANSYELMTRLHLQNGEVAKAELALEEAKRIMGSGQASEHRLIRKWSAILQGMKTNSVEPIEAYRASLTGLGNSEYRREADRFSLRLRFDEARFHHLVFGTSFPAYREMIFRELGRKPQQTELLFGDANAPILDLATGQFDSGSGLPQGTKIHALVEILMRDLYHGLPPGELYAELYPDERYDVFSSPQRVRQIVHRTRDWLQANHFPIELVLKDGYYSIERTSPVAFRLPLQRSSVEGYNQHLRLLRQHYGPEQIIHVNDARQKLQMARTSFFRFTTWAVSTGALEKTGERGSTTYKLAG